MRIGLFLALVLLARPSMGDVPGPVLTSDAGTATVLVLIDASGSMAKYRESVKDWAEAGTKDLPCVRTIETATFGAPRYTGRAAPSAEFCINDGTFSWDGGSVSGTNTPIGKALLAAAGRVPPNGLLIFLTDGEPECGARGRKDTAEGRKSAFSAASEGYRALQVAGTNRFFVHVATPDASEFNVFTGRGPLIAEHVYRLPEDGGLDLRPLLTARVRQFCDKSRVMCPEEEPEAVLVGQNGRFACTGVVIGPQAVLTAAHCLPADVVGVGPHAATAARHRVIRTHRAPPPLDVALVEVEGNLRIDRHIVISSAPPHGVLLSVGYGVSASNGFGERRQLTASARGWGCTDLALRETGCRPDDELYLPSSPGHDNCAGDSGGPVWQRMGQDACLEDGSLVSSRWRLVGVTSRSSDGASVACGQGSIATRVDRVFEWMKATGVSLRCTEAK